MAMNFKKNFQASVKKDALIDYAMAAAVPVYTAFAPSAFKINGWGAFAMAYGLPIVAGMAFNKRALTIAGVAMAAGHLAYQYGDKMFDEGIWELDSGDATKVNDYLAEGGVSYYTPQNLPPGAQITNINNEPVVSYPALNDYIYNQDDVNFMDDNIETFEYESAFDIDEESDRF